MATQQPSPRLPDLGQRGEGWVAIQVVLSGLIALVGSLGPAWGGALRTAGIGGGAVLVGAGALFALRGLVVLGGFFDLKSRREEAWLVAAYPGYAAYRARVRKLIPFVY